MSVEKIYLIRHGETDWNAEGRWQGMEPTPLNAQGLRQAEALAQYLAAEPIGVIYSSDLPRAAQTAQPLAKQLGLEPRYDPRWREIDVGIFQGLSSSEAEARYPEVMALWRSSDIDFRIPNGESRRMMNIRAYAAFQDVVQQAAVSHAAIVTHGGTIRRLLVTLLADENLDLHVPNTSITTLTRAGAGWTVTAWAETPHL